MLTIDVISDVICPWCFIGKRRLEKALGVRPATIRWHAFQLNPDMPREGIDRRAYRTRKFGSWERSLELDAQVAAAGRGEGIAFNFDRMARTPNTLAEIAAGAGLDRAEVDELLAGAAGLEAVRAGEREARRLGVSGVPFFVVNGQVALSGAQPPGLFLRAFEQADEAVVAGGACEVDPTAGKREC
jgi:predicted DsbA family dithiol-disulfide isomerase